MSSEALTGGVPAVAVNEPATESGATVGVFLVDKPAGPSSFRIVQQVRRALGIKKVGHAGTLDPFASGLLVICAGRPATRLIAQLMAGDKEYEATLRLGVETDTQDLAGTIVATRPVPLFDRATVERCLAGFIGEQLQTPPRFSALKHQGKPLYYYARRGVEVCKEPRRVVISRIDCLALGPDTLTIRVACGKGTYIRALAQDIGAALGCGAHLIELRRLRSGPFSVGDSLPGTALAEREAAYELLAASRRTVDATLDLLKEWNNRGESSQQ